MLKLSELQLRELELGRRAAVARIPRVEPLARLALPAQQLRQEAAAVDL